MSTNLRQIAAYLREAATDYPERRECSYTDITGRTYPAPPPGRATFAFGTLHLTCDATQSAILAMAAKFDRIPKLQGQGLPRLPSLHRPKGSDDVLVALEAECGEDAPTLVNCYGRRIANAQHAAA